MPQQLMQEEIESLHALKNLHLTLSARLLSVLNLKTRKRSLLGAQTHFVRIYHTGLR